jgi:hypothetical protein
MKGILRRLRPSPAMVVACTALVFAMTGAGYAAGMLGPNTVGTKQLKKNAVISSKVKNGSLLRADFKSGQIPAGPKGDKGDKGDRGDKGDKGDTGDTGPPGPLVDTLPAGKTVRGQWGILDTGTASGQLHSATISFPFRLAARPAAHIIAFGAPLPAGCAGDLTNPGAAPGHLCVFEAEQYNTNAPSICSWQHLVCYDGFGGTDGFAILATSTGTGLVETDGSWAVTGSSAGAAPTHALPRRAGAPTTSR